MGKKLTQKEVNDKDQKIGWIGLEPYINSYVKRLYLCPNCKKEVKITPSSVWNNESKCCRFCYRDVGSKKRTIPLQEVINRFRIKGFELLGDYTNQFTKTTIRCPCGRKFECIPHNIFGDYTKTCGQCNSPKINDRFGKLVITKIILPKIGGGCKVECLCDCGGSWKGFFSPIKAGRVKSCGCLISKGELEVKKILDKYKIKYIQQKKFLKCKDEKQLKFDFYLSYYNLCIEYNGQQHYEYYLFGSEEKKKRMFKQTQKHDRIKRKFCKLNNIELLEIKYTDYNKIEEIIKEKLRV